MINDLFMNNSTPSSAPTAEFARIRRDAIWWANLHQRQGTIFIYQNAAGRFFLSRSGTGVTGGTLITAVPPNPVYLSGERQEWREWQMQLGDRRQ